MNSSTINWDAISAGVAAFSLLVASFALFYQVSDLKRSIRSSTYQEIVKMFDEFARLMVQYPQLAKVIYHTNNPHIESTEDEIRIDWILAIRFDWFESVVVQQKHYKAIPPEVYDHWRQVLKMELKSPLIKTYWIKNRSYYHSDLQAVVMEVIAGDHAEHSFA